MFPASFAEFFENQLFLVFCFVFFGYIVLSFTDLTDQGYQNGMFFFCHKGIILSGACFWQVGGF